ncbi:MAG: phage tail tape measure protein [Desulfosporosinus sp.]|nr:phage tail tape measure protein [Desulfosporosinus sp.]
MKAIEIFKLFGSIMVNNDAANQAIDETDGKAQKTSMTFGEMLGSAARVGAGIAMAMGAAIVAVGGLAVSLTDDLQGALNNIQSQTGATDESMVEMKDTMLAIYNANLGENFDDIARAISEVGKQTGATGDELEDMTKDALMLRDTFEFEVTESVRTVDMMMKQFGISSDEAFNLIAQGAQAGLDKNGNLLDSINEYSIHFEQLGFDSEEMFNMMANGAKSGVFDIDKLGDAMKEFGIRSKDGSKTSAEGFAALGLNAAEMTAAFAKGGDASKEAFDKTTRALFEMDDLVAREAAGVALFGTQWEDVGAKGIEALVNTQGEISKTVDALGKINEVKYNTFAEAMRGIGRNLQTGILLPLGEKILPALNNFASWISDNMPAIQNEISYAMSIVGSVFDAIGAVVSTVIMPQFNAFRSMITENMPQIQEAIKAMYDYVKPSFDRLAESIKTNILPMIQGFWDLVQSAMPTIRVIFEVAMLAVGTALKIAMDVIAIFLGVVKGMYDFIKPPLDLVIGIFNKVSSAIEKALGWLLDWNGTPAKEKTVRVNYKETSSAKSVGERLGNNAKGTDFWRGGWTRVNEEGGEIMNLPRGTQIIPHDVSMEMARNSGRLSSAIVFERGAFEGAMIMDDYSVDRLMDRVMDRLALKGVK